MDKEQFYDCLTGRHREEKNKCFKFLKNVNGVLYGTKSYDNYIPENYDEEYELLKRSNKCGYGGNLMNVYQEYSERNTLICDGHTDDKNNAFFKPEDKRRMFRSDDYPRKMLVNTRYPGGGIKQRFHNVEKIDLIEECRLGHNHACAIITNRYFKARDHIAWLAHF